MPYCPSCGTRLPDNANFCSSCGARVHSVQRNTSVYDFNKEKREAIDAGKRALDSLYAARNELNKARNWGIADILGGGAITSMIKRSKMKDAQKYIELAKRDLRKFSNELSDVAGLMFLDFDANDFLSFADWFFDGFAVDFLVQDRINKAKNQVEEAISRVEHVLRQLNA
ncbi:MAG: zinc ribbon domain-containing protein [Oscillospiraceae bacterium]|nr:zinc ribbon domain-containing protein [Oscillospiraceae bacterium]